MSDVAEVEVIINSIANTAGFATAKSELAGMQLQTSPFASSFGGPLTSKESGYAKSQLASLEAQTVATKELSSAERDLSLEGNSVARAAGAMGIAGADAGGRLAALGGVMGSTGALGVGVGAAIIGLGAVAIMAKSVVDNVEAQDVATRELAQSVNAYNSQLGINIGAEGDVEKATTAHHKAVEQLQKVQAGMPTTHAATTRELISLRDAKQKVAETTTALTAATNEEKQAHNEHALSLSAETAAVQLFIDQNSRFIPNIYSVEGGYARLGRAGFDLTMQTRLMNDALDLSVAKGISLDSAVTILTSSSTGLSRGLLDLGISAKVVNAALGSGATETQKFDALLAVLEPRIAKSRDDTGSLAQGSNRLNTEWQKLTSNNQPLPDFIALVENKTADFLTLLANSDSGPNSPWGAFQRGIIGSISLIELLQYGLDQVTGNIPGAPNLGGSQGRGFYTRATGMGPMNQGGRVGGMRTLTSQ